MGFEKGNSLGGRKKGSKAKTTKEAREIFNNIMAGKIDLVDKALDDILEEQGPAKFLDMVIRLMRFYFPTKTEMEVTRDEAYEFNFNDVIEKLKGQDNDN